MSSNLPPGCGKLPGEVDDGISDLQEEVLSFLEANTFLPEIINDHIIELVIFYEKTDPMPERDYSIALAKRLRWLTEKLDRKIAGKVAAEWKTVKRAKKDCPICFGFGRVPMPHSDEATQDCECLEDVKVVDAGCAPPVVVPAENREGAR